MSFNTDVLVGGQGIFLDKTNSNSVSVVNTNQEFNIGPNSILSILVNFATNPTNYSYKTSLIDFKNYLKISTFNTI